MALALSLAGLKAAAGLASGSLAILASALDSAMDFLTSAGNYVSLVFSRTPADAEHPYGHGKAEAVAGAVQGGLIAAGGVALLVEGVRRALREAPVEADAWGIGVMLASMVLSVAHGRRLMRAAGETGSTVLKAEGLHFSMDVLANLGVLLALAVVRLGGAPAWDVVISLLIAGFVVREAGRLVLSSAQELLDRSLSEEVHRDLEELIRSHPHVAGFHALRTRRAGPRVFIDFHVEIAGVEGFREAHEITERLIDRIRERIPNADVTVHADPPGAR